MPHLIGMFYGDQARVKAAEPAPFGPGVKNPGVTRMEVWGSSANDSGDDWCEFRLFDADGNIVSVRRENGY